MLRTCDTIRYKVYTRVRSANPSGNKMRLCISVFNPDVNGFRDKVVRY